MGRAYNLGSGTGASVLEVLRACEAAAGRPIPHEIAGRRPGDPAVLIASPEKIARELGWKPRFSRHPRDRPDRLELASPPSRWLLVSRLLNPAPSLADRRHR